MSFISNVIVRKILLGLLKGLLDKLPANGRKTILGVIVTIIGAVISYFGPALPLDLGYFLDILKQAGEWTIDAGVATTIVGVVHKLLKWIDERPDGKKETTTGWENFQ